jgi:hypothetical protein
MRMVNCLSVVFQPCRSVEVCEHRNIEGFTCLCLNSYNRFCLTGQEGHCHLKGHLFKLGLTDDPICERCLQEDESATHILCNCEAVAHVRFRHLGQFFLGTKWLLWRRHIQSPTLHSRCWINKGLIKRGSTIDHWRSRCKGWIFGPLLIHTYIQLDRKWGGWQTKRNTHVLQISGCTDTLVNFLT